MIHNHIFSHISKIGFRNDQPSPRARSIQARRGASAIFGIFLCAAIFTLLATITEFAHIDNARTEMTRSADSAALAAAWELYEAQIQNDGTADTRVMSAADHYGNVNRVAGTSHSLAQSDGSVEMGVFDAALGTFQATGDYRTADAVRVRYDLIDGQMGEVPLFFGGLTGRSSQPLRTTSIAHFSKDIVGFEQPWSESNTIDILPIALDLDTWNAVQAQSTEDRLAYVDGEVRSGSDGWFECSLYPTGTGSPGNRGTVDIGSRSNSTSDLRRQITDGISAQDFIDLGKPLVFDGNGELELNGDTGISAGIKAQLSEIIGEKRVIPIFTEVNGNGNNANYTIVAWAGIRVLAVKLTGPMKKKHLTIQPAPMVVRGGVTGSGSSNHSSHVMTPARLVN